MHLTCTRKIAALPHRTGDQPHRCQDVIACASLLSIILLHKHKHMGQHKTHIHNTGLSNYVGWTCLQASMLSGAKAPHDIRCQGSQGGNADKGSQGGNAYKGNQGGNADKRSN